MQTVIVPCGITASMSDDERQSLIDACKAFEQSLKASGVRVRGDYRDNYSPGWKFNHWELKVGEQFLYNSAINISSLIVDSSFLKSGIS